MNIPFDPVRRRLIVASCGLAGATLAGRTIGAETAGRGRTLEFGVVPYLPTARLLTVFEPLRAYFAAAFQRPVALSTAPDFKSFQRRALDGELDVYFIGPGPGWQIHRDRQHLVVAAAKAVLSIYLLVAKAGPVRQFADLRGQTLATIDPLTVAAQVALAVLQKHGLKPGIDVALHTEKNPFNAAQAVALGEAAAAACPDMAFPSLPAELRDKLEILYRSEGLPNGLLMANHSADLPPLEMIRQSVFAFDESPAGQIFGKESGLESLVPPDVKKLAMLDRFVPEVRRMMSEP